VVRIGLYAVSADAGDRLFSGVQLIFHWDPGFLKFLGVDNTGATSLLISDVSTDPYGLNEIVPPQDGDGLYLAVALLGKPALAKVGGTLLTTFRFEVLAETCGTPIEAVAQGGSPLTYSFVRNEKNQDVLGAFGSTIVGTGLCSPSIVSAASRKTHGSVEFDIPLPLESTSAGVECRTGGPKKAILNFSEPVKAADGTPDETEVSLSSGTLGSVTIDGNQMTLAITGVPDPSCLTITLAGITDLEGNALTGIASVRILVLAGDANANKTVNAQDMLAVRAHIGEMLSATNARYDVNCNGSINAQDLLAIRTKVGHTAPSCP
jgi:hypothetical protein